MIISTRSGYQVRNQCGITFCGGGAQESGHMSFICPWGQCPWSRWLGCHDKLCLHQETCHILWGFCAPHLHFGTYPERLAASEQVGVQPRTWPMIDGPGCCGNQTCDLPVRNRFSLSTRPPCSRRRAALWSQLHVGHQTELREEKMCQGQMIYFCSFVDFFASHCSVLSVEYIHDMHYGGVVVAENWILILPSFALFPKSDSHLLCRLSTLAAYLHQAECISSALSKRIVTNCRTKQHRT